MEESGRVEIGEKEAKDRREGGYREERRTVPRGEKDSTERREGWGEKRRMVERGRDASEKNSNLKYQKFKKSS